MAGTETRPVARCTSIKNEISEETQKRDSTLRPETGVGIASLKTSFFPLIAYHAPSTPLNPAPRIHYQRQRKQGVFIIIVIIALLFTRRLLLGLGGCYVYFDLEDIIRGVVYLRGGHYLDSEDTGRFYLDLETLFAEFYFIFISF